MELKWNVDKFGIEIKTDDEHFVISAKPSMIMSWEDSMRFYKDDTTWKLPTIKQTKLVAENIDEINNIIEENNGYPLFGFLWTCETTGKDAWFVNMFIGNSLNNLRLGNYYVRPVYALD